MSCFIFLNFLSPFYYFNCFIGRGEDEMKKVLFVIISLFIICLSGCSYSIKAEAPNFDYEPMPEYGVVDDAMFEGLEGEEYTEITEGGFISPERIALSSFSLDSSSYAYSNLRRLIKENYTIFA